VHRDPADVVAQQLTFAGVQPDPDLEAVLGQFGADGVGGADRPGRAVEGGQEPATDRGRRGVVPGRPSRGEWARREEPAGSGVPDIRP
jgi:hypothetical protein